MGFVSSVPALQNAPSTFRAGSAFQSHLERLLSRSFKAKENLTAAPERAHSSVEETVVRVRRGAAVYESLG